MLNLELLQVTGAFKARGAVNKLLSLSEEQLQRGIITASGGNHGIAVAYAGWIAKIPVMVYLPSTTPEAKINKLREWGAQVIIEGQFFDDAKRAAEERAERDGIAFFHPFADEHIIAGQGTVGLEMVEDLPDVDTIIVAIGGGGLAAGVSTAVRALKPDARIIGVEPTGAPTLKRSLEAGKVIKLETVETAAGTLSPSQTAQINLDIIRQNVDDIILVTDDEMIEASRWLWFEMALAAEMSGAASMATLLTGKLKTAPDERVCALICGAGMDWMR